MGLNVPGARDILSQPLNSDNKSYFVGKVAKFMLLIALFKKFLS